MRRRLAIRTAYVDCRASDDTAQQRYAAEFHRASEPHPEAEPIRIGLAQITTKLLNTCVGAPGIGASRDEAVAIFISLAKIAAKVLNGDVRMASFL